MRAIKTILVLGILSLVFPPYAVAFNDILSDIYCSEIIGSDDLSQFHIAVCKGDVEAVKKVIEKGININQTFIVNARPFSDENYHYEFNALHTALMRYKYAEYLQEFPEPLGGTERPDINKEDYGRIIQLLIKNGIDTEYPFRWWSSKDIKTPPGHIDEFRPINLASNYEIAELLQKGGAKISPLIFSQKKGGYNYFRGNIIVSGKIASTPTYYEGDSWNELCMHVDRDTFYLIPRVNDFRSDWFCLKVDRTLLTKMKIDGEKIKHKCFSGFAKIQITNYRQVIGESGYDDAELVKLIKAKDYSYKKCSASDYFQRTR